MLNYLRALRCYGSKFSNAVHHSRKNFLSKIAAKIRSSPSFVLPRIARGRKEVGVLPWFRLCRAVVLSHKFETRFSLNFLDSGSRELSPACPG
jgi:hypothetical protein